MEHEFYTGLSIAIMGFYAVKKMGPATAKFLDAEVAVSQINNSIFTLINMSFFIADFYFSHQKSDAELNSGRDMSIQIAKNKIEGEKVEQDRALSQKMLFDAKRENVALQLEAAYREQLVKVYTEVISF